MSRGKKSPEVRKSESPEVSRKSEVGSSKPEEGKAERPKRKADFKPEKENNSEIDIPHSDLTTKSEIENTTSEIEKMEVHHHPQLEHKPKAWREYLLEGFMIFLAVMMGFFAEGIRENISENAKGKEYIRSFVEDLRSDTAQYDASIRELTVKDSILNQIYACLDTVKQKHHTPVYMSEIIAESSGFTDFIYTDRTIQQLKNSGGLRMIHDKGAADSIITYDALVRAELIHQGTMEEWQKVAQEAHLNMVPTEQLNNINIKTAPDKQTGRIILLSNDPRELDGYFNKMWMFKTTCAGQKKRLKRLSAKAVRTIAFLEKQLN